jgi:hypothetical protein
LTPDADVDVDADEDEDEAVTSPGTGGTIWSNICCKLHVSAAGNEVRNPHPHGADGTVCGPHSALYGTCAPFDSPKLLHHLDLTINIFW